MCLQIVTHRGCTLVSNQQFSDALAQVLKDLEIKKGEISGAILMGDLNFDYSNTAQYPGYGELQSFDNYLKNSGIVENEYTLNEHFDAIIAMPIVTGMKLREVQFCQYSSYGTAKTGASTSWWKDEKACMIKSDTSDHWTHITGLYLPIY